MKRKWNKGLLTLTMALTLIGITACGNQPSAETFDNETEIEESTIEETETIESEEETAESSAENEEIEEPLQTASGHQHNIDVEEMNANDAEEEVLKEEREEEVQTTVVAEKKETEVQSQTSTATETTTAETAESVQTATINTDTIPETITMDPSFVKCSMYVVYDTQVKDAPYAASGNQGLITRGSNIGVTGQCPGFYQVNYGAKRSFLPKDCLSSRQRGVLICIEKRLWQFSLVQC